MADEIETTEEVATETTETPSTGVTLLGQTTETADVDATTETADVVEEELASETNNADKVPESADAYEFTRDIPEEMANLDPESMAWFKQVAFENGLTPAIAQALLTAHDARNKEFFEKNTTDTTALQEADKVDFDTRVAELKAELGGDSKLQSAVGNVQTVIEELGITQEQLDKDGFSNSVIGVKIVNHLIGLTKESKTITNGSQTSVNSIDDQLSQITSGGMDSPYYDANHPDHKTVMAKFNSLQDQKLKLAK